MIKVRLFYILIFFSITFSQDCNDNMLMYDCVGTWFCNDEATYGYDCYVNNEFCEDFNGDGIVDSWVGDGWCDDGEWGYNFQCEDYSYDCGDCGDDYSDDFGYCSHVIEMSNFEHDGINRQYYFYKPENLAENAPLLFVLHGYTSNANSIMSYSNMNSIADQNGFAVCYPQGTSDNYNNNFWNVGYAFNDNQTVDDVDFLTSLASYLQNEHNLSAGNTFSTGMSNGGDMSYMLACQAHDTFSAIAPIAGSMLESIYDSCDGVPVPVLEIHGTNDNTTLWEGDMENNDGWGAYLSTLDAIDYWVDVNDCQESEDINLPNTDFSDGSYVINHRYYDCAQNNEVWLYEVVNGGHDWPGAYGNMDIDASSEIWRFLEQFTFTVGDVNQDNILNILDVIYLIDLILGGESNNSLADMNGDGQINVIDVVFLVNLILSE
mgnify:CR=1 FL=1